MAWICTKCTHNNQSFDIYLKKRTKEIKSVYNNLMFIISTIIIFITEFCTEEREFNKSDVLWKQILLAMYFLLFSSFCVDLVMPQPFWKRPFAHML